MKILINIAGKNFEVSPQEAERIYNELGKLFGKKQDQSIPYNPYVTPYNPDRIWWEEWKDWKPYTITSNSAEIHSDNSHQNAI